MAMAVYTMRYAIENGMEIVGAVDINPNVIGKDVGTIINTSNTGVSVRNVSELDALLKECKPNVAIVTTMSLMKYVKDVLVHTVYECRTQSCSTADHLPEL